MTYPDYWPTTIHHAPITTVPLDTYPFIPNGLPFVPWTQPAPSGLPFAQPWTQTWIDPMTFSPPICKAFSLTLDELESLKDGVNEAIAALQDRRQALKDERERPEWPLTTADIDVLIKRLDDQSFRLAEIAVKL